MPRGRKRIDFSRADVSESNSSGNSNIIRPNENRDVMMGEEGMDIDEKRRKEMKKSRDDKSIPSMKGDEEEEGEEGRIIKGQKATYVPSKEEWDVHMRSHIPFRRWCPFCVKGRCKSGAHLKSKKSEEDKEREVAVISVDYLEPKSKEGKKEGIDSLPILGGIDRKMKWHLAMMVVLVMCCQLPGPERGRSSIASYVALRGYWVVDGR